MASQCRLRPEELIAYRDDTLPAGRREIVDAHLAVCPSCRDSLVTFDEVDRIIQEAAVTLEVPERRRAALHIRLQQEADRQSRWPRRLQRFSSSTRRPFVAGILVLLVLLTALPAMTEASFPLGHFVRFAQVEIKERLPLDEQEPIRGVAPSGPDVAGPSFPAVMPAELPLGLVRVEQSTPSSEWVELLYRNEADVALLVTQLPAEIGSVTLEREGTEVTQVRGMDVLLVRDSRPDAVAAFTWERDGVFFDVLVIEAPTGGYGGFKRADALQVVEAMMVAQDVTRE